MYIVGPAKNAGVESTVGSVVTLSMEIASIMFENMTTPTPISILTSAIDLTG